MQLCSVRLGGRPRGAEPGELVVPERRDHVPARRRSSPPHGGNAVTMDSSRAGLRGRVCSHREELNNMGRLKEPARRLTGSGQVEEE